MPDDEKSDLELIKEVKPPEVKEEAPASEEEKPEKDKQDEEEPVEEDKLPPSWSRVSQEYPDFFKKFPEIRDLIGRDKAYSDLFPTIEDAREITEKAESFDTLAEKLSEGDLGPVMSSLEGEELTKLAESFLPTLAKQNEDLYYRTTAPVIDQLLKAAFREGKLKDDENLANAAYWVSKWALGDGKFATGDASFRPLEIVKKDDKLEKEKEEFYNEKYSTFRDGVIESCNNQIDDYIKKDIDDLSPRVQKLVLREVREELASQLQNDGSHMSRLRSLWKRAESVGYVGDIKSRIISTYLERAKSLSPAIAEKVRNEIAVEKVKSEPTVSLSGKSVKVGAGPVDAKRVDWSKTSEIDAIRGKVTMKG